MAKAKEFVAFPPIVCERLRRLTKVLADAEKKKADMVATRDEAEERVHGCVSSDTKEREQHEAEFGRAVMQITRWNRAIKRLEREAREIVETADEPGLYDTPEIRITDYLKDDEDDDQADGAKAPRSRSKAGPQPDAALDVDLRKLVDHGLPDRIAAKLIKAGYETIEQLHAWLWTKVKEREWNGLDVTEEFALNNSITAYTTMHRSKAGA